MLQNRYKDLDFLPNNQKKTHKKHYFDIFFDLWSLGHTQATNTPY